MLFRIWKENEAEKMKKKHEEIERLKAHRKGQLDEREKLREDVGTSPFFSPDQVRDNHGCINYNPLAFRQCGESSKRRSAC